MRKMNSHAFERLYKEYQESGLSVHDFCSNQDIVVSTFYYWQRKFRASCESPKEFVPLIIEKSPECISTHTPKETFNFGLEFIFPNGTKLVLPKNIDPTMLKTIVHLYD